MLQIKDWETWQSYRKDRGAPPWIKLHTRLLADPQWCALSDSDKGCLVSIWMIAASNNGQVTSDPSILRKLCLLDKKPNINKFIELGFLVTTTCQPNGNHQPTKEKKHDGLEVETEVYKQETETESRNDTLIYSGNIQDLNLAQKMADAFTESHKEDIPNHQVLQWADIIRDMRIMDKRTHAQIFEKWEWAQEGWWKANGVRVTPDMLRAKWLFIKDPNKAPPSDWDEFLDGSQEGVA